MKNLDPTAPWNDPKFRDDPKAPHNRGWDGPWNRTFWNPMDLSREERQYYGIDYLFYHLKEAEMLHKENAFARIPTVQPTRETAQEEIDWLLENYKLDFYLIRRSLIAAYRQRLRIHPEKREFLIKVINYLQNY
jgi:hypothetical protein